MIIDSHQHFWKLERGDYPWPNSSVMPIFKNFMPVDLLPYLRTCGIHKTILVQATDTVDETKFLLSLAYENDFVAGVVGWVDLASPTAIDEIDLLRNDPNLLGLRPMLQNIEQTDWILQPQVLKALRHLASKNMVMDALIQPRHLEIIFKLQQEVPELPIVVDHCAKPKMGKYDEYFAEWQRGMRNIAKNGNAYCKISGLITEAGADWKQEQLEIYAKFVIDVFGKDRVMWGSDWPVINLDSDYLTWFRTAREYVSSFTKTECEAVFGGNAARFYGLNL